MSPNFAAKCVKTRQTAKKTITELLQIEGIFLAFRLPLGGCALLILILGTLARWHAGTA